MKNVVFLAFLLAFFFSTSLSTAFSERGSKGILLHKPIKTNVHKNKAPLENLKKIPGLDAPDLPKPKAIPPSPGSPIEEPCAGIPPPEENGKCGDGVCEDSEYNPKYPALMTTSGGEQYYSSGSCEESCVKDCGIFCSNNNYVWDMSECKPSATYVETKCKIPSYPYENKFVLSMNYPTVFFLCSDNMEYIKINFADTIWLEGKHIYINLNIESGKKTADLYPQGNKVIMKVGDNESIIEDLLVSFTPDWENYVCFDLDSLNLKNKKICIDIIAFPGPGTFLYGEPILKPTFYYKVKYK